MVATIARANTETYHQHCLDGERELKQVFALLLQHIKARENDLVHELHFIRKTAGKNKGKRERPMSDNCAGVFVASILERRKATLTYLKQTATSSGELDESQLSELVQQMKASHT